MFRCNPAANYQPNEGQHLQVLSGKDLYKQTIVVSDRDTFPARFPKFLLIIHWGKCMWVINCGHTEIMLLCDYDKLS